MAVTSESGGRGFVQIGRTQQPAVEPPTEGCISFEQGLECSGEEDGDV